MFKKATSRQLLSVSGLFILVWQTTLGQEQWKGNTYLPEPLPVRKIEKNKDTSVLGKQDHQVLVYNARSGELRFPDLTPKAIPNPLAAETLSWPDSFQSFFPPLSKKFSSLSKVEDLTVAPWRMQVKLFVTGAKGQRYTCSGTLIDPEYVLTACHCIYSFTKGGWAEQVEVVPAYETGEAPYGTAQMEEALVWEEWVEQRNYKYDVAVLKLNRPVGAITGWLAYGFRSDGSFFKTETFNNPGYPASGTFDGQELYNWKGTFDYVYDSQLAYHKNEAFAGQSGSGAFFQEEGGSAVVLSVLSHGTPQPNPFTGHVRLTKEKFTTIHSYIEEAKTPELDVRPLFLKTDKKLFTTAEPFDYCSFILYNPSKEDFQQSLELALDLYDDTGHAIELGRTNLEDVKVQKGKRLFIELKELGLAWPEQLQAGNYFLAIRLLLKDADVSNNLSPASERTSLTIEKAEVPDYIDLSHSELIFSADGGEQILELQTHADQFWQVHKPVDWIAVNPLSGKGSANVRIKVLPHTGTDQRAASLLISAGVAEKEVHVVQESNLSVDEISLSPGWNLVSLDVEPLDNQVKTIVKGLKPDNLLQLIGLVNGTYQYYRPSNSEKANSLIHFQPGAGYWVQVKEPDKLIVRGHPLAEDHPLSLQTGRNLVAYIPQEPQSPQTFFKDLIDAGRLKYVIAFKKGRSLRFSPQNPDGSSLQWLENGMGCWVEIASPASVRQLATLPKIESPRSGIAPLGISNGQLDFDIQHFPVDDTFYIQINNQQKGTLLLMISDHNGRLLKKQQLLLRQWEGALFPLTYESHLSPYLVVSIFFNQQHIDSRVYLND